MNNQEKPHQLLRGKLLFRNILLDGLSKIIPIGVAILLIPILISDLGDEKFGLLSIVWVIMSFAHLMDFGLSRAIVKFVSEKIGNNKEDEIIGVFSLSWLLMFFFALIFCTAILVFKTNLLHSVFNIEEQMIKEAELAIIYTAVAAPFVFSNSVFISILKAYQEFYFITIINTINSILNYSLPIIILLFTDDFSIIILAIVSLKLLAFLGYLIFLILKRAWIFKVRYTFMKSQLSPVLKFGGWVSISNLINPLIAYMDRFLIASIISIAAVTYYVTPMDIVLKIGALSLPIVSVLFPAISVAQENDKNKVPRILKTGIVSITVFIFPLFLFLGLFSFEILELWINSEFAAKSELVLKILSAGVIIKSLASMPYSYLHGSDKPKIVAVIHLIELPIYLVIVLAGLNYFGIVGAAIAYCFRNLLDYILLSFFADQNMERDQFFVNYLIDVFILIMLFSAVFFIEDFNLRIIYYFLTIPTFVFLMWQYRFTMEMKNILTQYKANN